MKSVILLINIFIILSIFISTINAVIPTKLSKQRELYHKQMIQEMKQQQSSNGMFIFDQYEQSILDNIESNQTLWFDQFIDHYDPFNNDTWQQQYQVTDDWFGGDAESPIFIFLAGEAPMGFFNFQEVQIKVWAQQFKAMYIVLEHRYYGDSYPTKDLSTENLRFLTSQQALADAANFLETFKQSRGLLTNPIVVFGCSYSGALSAWFRLKYPQLAVASIAPSGPVLANLNFTGYFGQFQNSAAPSCVQAAQQASDQIMQLISNEHGIKYLEKTFNSCHSLKNPRDLYYFIYTIVGVLGSSDQMNNPPTWILNQTCNQFTQNSNLLENWAALVSEGSTGCIDYSLDSFIKSAREISISEQDGTRSWTWQTCVEFGYFSTTYPGTSVFPGVLNVEEQVRWCSEIFDIPKMTPNIDWTNGYYGGQNIQGSNIMFTNGLLDPWSLLSVRENSPDGRVYAAVYEAGHCGSLIQSTSIDPPSLVNAREEVVSFLKVVLSQ